MGSGHPWDPIPVARFQGVLFSGVIDIWWVWLTAKTDDVKPPDSDGADQGGGVR